MTKKWRKKEAESEIITEQSFKMKTEKQVSIPHTRHIKGNGKQAQISSFLTLATVYVASKLCLDVQSLHQNTGFRICSIKVLPYEGVTPLIAPDNSLK